MAQEVEPRDLHGAQRLPQRLPKVARDLFLNIPGLSFEQISELFTAGWMCFSRNKGFADFIADNNNRESRDFRAHVSSPSLLNMLGVSSVELLFVNVFFC